MALYEYYPDFTTDIIKAGQDKKSYLVNLNYLAEQDLVNANIQRSLSGAFIFEGAKINSAGIGYLIQNGLVKKDSVAEFKDNSNIIKDKESKNDTQQSEKSIPQESKKSSWVIIAEGTAIVFLGGAIFFLFHEYLGIKLN